MYKWYYYEDQTTANSIQLGYQFTAIGFEYYNHVGIFIEAGYGYKGIANLGICYAFPQH